MADEEIVVWLTGALDELERVALATTPQADKSELHQQYDERAWKANPDGSVVEGRTDTLPVLRASDEAAAHIALNDPRAALARVQAERAMLERYTRSARWARTAHPVYGSREFDENIGAVAAFAVCVRHLAHAHRFDAPGYRDEWRPDA